MPRIICHIDVDSFAVAVARIHDPTLRDRPVAVANSINSRGVITCVSTEARRLAIYPGMSLGRAKRRSPDLLHITEDVQASRQASVQLYRLLQESAPVVEMAGRGSFFLDLTGCERLFGGDLHHWVIHLATTIFNDIHLPVSTGLASNKLVARLASRTVKPEGHIRILPRMEKLFMEGLPVDMLPGIDFHQARRLKDFGISFVADLERLSPEAFSLLFGQKETQIRQAIEGICYTQVRPRGLASRLSVGHLLKEETTQISRLEALVSRLAQQLAWQIRIESRLVRTANLELVYSDEIVVTRNLALPVPTDEEEYLAYAARAALRAVFTRRVRVRRIYLHGSYVAAIEGQPDFLREQERCSKTHLHQAMERVRHRHGFTKLLSVSSLRPLRDK